MSVPGTFSAPRQISCGPGAFIGNDAGITLARAGMSERRSFESRKAALSFSDRSARCRSGFERGCCLHPDGRSLKTMPDGRGICIRPVRLCPMSRLDSLYNLLFVLCPDLTPIVQFCIPLSGTRNALVGDGWRYFRKPSRPARTFHSRSQSKD
jgi:hypothetical protein